MTRKWMAGIAAGILVATALILVGARAYRAGERNAADDGLFERFARAADSGGSGLGLTIARQLVEAHGGTLRAANDADSGARFTATLPRS